jgi:hypothetical protein
MKMGTLHLTERQALRLEVLGLEGVRKDHVLVFEDGRGSCPTRIEMVHRLLRFL